MVDDNWSVKIAMLCGMILGPPLRIACDGMLGEDMPETVNELFIYLLTAVVVGTVGLGLLALLRNRLLAQAGQS
jgi:hypothetical protein